MCDVAVHWPLCIKQFDICAMKHTQHRDQFVFDLRQVPRVNWNLFLQQIKCFEMTSNATFSHSTRLFAFGWIAYCIGQLSVCKIEKWHIHCSHRRHGSVTCCGRCTAKFLPEFRMGWNCTRRKCFAWWQLWTICAKSTP